MMISKASNTIHIEHRHVAGLVLMACCMFYGCKEKYIPSVKDNNINYLVIEGWINTGTDSTIFTLSRTFKLNNKPIELSEKGAIVQVESDAGATYVLPALVKAGRYGRPALGLDATKKHRLRIRTSDKREYLSDFVESRTAPPIDDLKFDLNNNHVNVFAYSHDPSGNSRYYRYSYVETIEYTSSLVSYFTVKNNRVVERDWPDEMIWRCYKPILSNDIVLASSVNLNEDVIADKPIVSVPRGSIKIRLGYSVQVKQAVLTKEGFEFYESLKKNTESVGTIIDAQPSQLFGNIRSTTDPTEVVIGFVSAGTITDKRITIMSSELPQDWFLPREIDSLCLKTVKGMSEPEIVAQHPVWIPLQRTLRPPGVTIDGYTATNDYDCVDCRRQGGTTVKPPYWK